MATAAWDESLGFVMVNTNWGRSWRCPGVAQLRSLAHTRPRARGRGAGGGGSRAHTGCGRCGRAAVWYHTGRAHSLTVVRRALNSRRGDRCAAIWTSCCDDLVQHRLAHSPASDRPCFPRNGWDCTAVKCSLIRLSLTKMIWLTKRASAEDSPARRSSEIRRAAASF